MKPIYRMLSGFLIFATMLIGSPARSSPMHLGNFSVSLSVKDIRASKDFYEELGFVQILGDTAQGWAIMKNGDTNIGLFQGVFEKNMLTFNPGWDRDGKPDGKSEDIRAIQKRLKASGIDVGTEIEAPKGPASFTITDPDGNPILFDQHL